MKTGRKSSLNSTAAVGKFRGSWVEEMRTWGGCVEEVSTRGGWVEEVRTWGGWVRACRMACRSSRVGMIMGGGSMVAERP